MLNVFRKRTTFATNQLPSVSVDECSMINDNISASQSSVITTTIATAELQQQLSTRESPPPKPSTVGTTRRRSSLSPSDSYCIHHQASSSTSLSQTQRPPSPYSPLHQPHSLHTCTAVRRTSMPAKRNAPAFVRRDELWLTQRQCKPKCLLNDGAPLSDGKCILPTMSCCDEFRPFSLHFSFFPSFFFSLSFFLLTS